MKKILFISFLSLFLIENTFTLVNAQSLPNCGILIPDNVSCINFDGTVRSGTTNQGPVTGDGLGGPVTGDGLGGPVTGDGLSQTVKLVNPLKIDNIQDLLAVILSAIVQIAIPFLVLAVMYVGFLFVAARGNPNKLAEARQALFYTLFGALIILGAQTLSIVLSGTIKQLTDGVGN